VNDRERYLETLLFGKPDRIPFSPGGPRESTLKAWREQGLPEGANWYTYVLEQIGLEPPSQGPRPGVWMRHTMIPEFEEKVLEEKEDSLIVQDWKGNICEISRRFDVTYLRYARDFVTRRWIKCPVEGWADWEAMQSRYDPDDPARLPENLPELGEQLKGRDYPVGVGFHGPFWQLREWLGFEGLCMLFLDDPALVKDMLRFWTDYISRLLLRLLPYVTLDYVHISEDMAYKEKPMIGPEMTREFLQPCYLQWNEILKGHGVPIYDVDSDGYVGSLIPVWIESGLNVCDPMEVAAGNDIQAYRREFGTQMAFTGGVDKRAIAKGGDVLRAEMERMAPVVRSGGFIPGCDHGVPPDISLSNFIEYGDLLACLTGWK
jgi:uroporphyrinogen decarboxylase